MEINESRVVTLENKVIDISDIKKLALFLLKEKDEIEQQKINVDVSFAVETFDKSEFKSESGSVFDDDSPINNRPVKGVELKLRDLSDEKRDVSIELNHGRGAWVRDSKIRVSGNNSKWVNGTLTQIEEIINSIEPQNTYLKRFEMPISIFINILVGYIVYLCIGYLLSLAPSISVGADNSESTAMDAILNIPGASQVITLILFYFMGLMFGGEFIMRKLKSLWPSIELRVGPEYNQIELKRRGMLFGIFVLIIIPITINLITK